MTKQHRARLMRAALAVLTAVSLDLAAESGGKVLNACSPGPFLFTFSSLPDSCSLDGPGTRCPQAGPADISYARGFLLAPGGIMDYGRLEDFTLDREIAVPSAGYEDSVPFRSRRLYALKVGERGYALIAEVGNFIGACAHQDFRWRYNDSGNHFRGGFPEAIPVGVRAPGEERVAPGDPGGPPERGFDAQGRACPEPAHPDRPVRKRFSKGGG
jgi:hypothetical protein